MIACPRSYGITVSKPFTAIDHSKNELSVDPVTGKPMAKDQLMWFIKKGDVILSNEPRIVEESFAKIFSENDLRRGEIPIYAYDDDDIPERFANARNGKFILIGHSSMIYALTCLRINPSSYA